MTSGGAPPPLSDSLLTAGQRAMACCELAPPMGEGRRIWTTASFGDVQRPRWLQCVSAVLRAAFLVEYY